MALIQLENVSFAYNGWPVLAGVTLAVAKGERLALLGPNGAGKSTLLKLISGILKPQAGAVLLDGRPPTAFPQKQLAQRIGMVPQEFVVPFSFTVREIVELGRTPHLERWAHYDSAHRHAVEKALEATGTSQLSNRIFNQLSGGERRRVMIAMAVAQEPEILLLDEPTQQLDISRQGDVLDLITELNISRGMTVIAAIHDLNLAARFFDRLVMLHRASIAADGAPCTVLRRSFLQEVYGGPIEVRASFNGDSPVILPQPRATVRVEKQKGHYET